jgi:hypothetical protein
MMKRDVTITRQVRRGPSHQRMLDFHYDAVTVDDHIELYRTQ